MLARLRLSGVLCLIVFSSAAANAADQPSSLPSFDSPATGVLPLGSSGKPLNLDFEKGTLDDWTATGDAFAGQPVKGDTVSARRSDMKSQHKGQYWIGGFETAGDKPQGTLTSAPFKVTHPFASFRIAGGRNDETRVELIQTDRQQVIFRQSGDDTESLKPVIVDLQPYLGKEIVIRLVDEHSGPWGHVNFDDFKFHATAPHFDESLAPPPLAPLDEYPFAGLPPEQAAKEMVVPEGFKVQLFAGEPDVKQPIAMALDDRGRLWIAEAYTYPIRAAEGQGKDRILIFEDTDGDGHFDKRKVFAENLNLVSGMEVGFGGVWIGAAPYLMFIPDKDGDDVPDGPPQILLDGWAFQDTHETLNTFSWGPDGWLYGCHGVFTHSNVGRPGAPDKERTRINAGIWRYHPTRHVFEVFGEGTSNPWGIDFNDYGQAFCTACVIPHLYHVIQGARYQRQAGEHFNPYTYDDIKTIAVHRHWIGETPHSGNNRSDAAGGGHAHAGAMVYLGGGWPEKYRNQIFMNNIHGQRINQDLLSVKGSGYEGNRAPDFCMARDRWSQILNLQYGPDGQVYMIDWYDANACHHNDPNGHDRTNGRIFKIVYKDPDPVHIDLKKQTDAELVDQTLNGNEWYVRHSRRILQERGARAKVLEGLSKIAFTHSDETRRLRALWALHVTGNLSEPLILKALDDQGPYVRGWALQLATEENGREVSSTLLQKMVEMSQRDPTPQVRLYLLAALQRMPLAQRWDALAALAAHAEDAGDHNLPLMLWYAAEPLAEQNMGRLLTLALDGKSPVLLSYSVRRIGAIGSPEAIALLTGALDKANQQSAQMAILEGLNQSLKGRRKVAMPSGWPKTYEKLSHSPSYEMRSQLNALAVTFGDPAALKTMRKLLVEPRAELATRKQALESLLGSKDKELAPTLQKLVYDVELRGPALRALAAYDDSKTPEVIVKLYDELNLAEKRDALNTLASRAPYALALLAAVADKKISSGDLSADLIRQLKNHKNADLDKQISEVWGTARETNQDKAQQIAHYMAMIREPAPADPALGRAVFAKTCQQCHTLFGTGGKVGPELTGSNRANLEYVLSNVVDPSAVMAKEYQPSIVTTNDGRVITGIVREQSQQAVTLQTANEQVILPRDEIDEMHSSPQSMMPEELLKPLGDLEIRSLVAYLASPAQTPMLATSDNVKGFFNGHDLTGWQGELTRWKVEEGQIVGKTMGLSKNEFLKSDLLLGDFRLKLQIKLVGNQGNSGIQFRSEVMPDGTVKGYQADVGEGWWGKLYEEQGRELLWTKSGETWVKPGEWNTYEVVAVGHRVRTWINGHACVDLDDPGGALRGITAFQLHSGGPTEVRFKDIELELNPALDASARK